jgi:protease I
VSPKEGEVKGWKHTDWGDLFRVDVPLDRARAEEFDALVLPGGVIEEFAEGRHDAASRAVRTGSGATRR